MKRILTTKPATKISHSGAWDSSKGRAVNWADPAYTKKVINRACTSVKPDLSMAIPVTKPQIDVAVMAGNTSLKPSTKCIRWRGVGRHLKIPSSRTKTSRSGTIDQKMRFLRTMLIVYATLLELATIDRKST